MRLPLIFIVLVAIACVQCERIGASHVVGHVYQSRGLSRSHSFPLHEIRGGKDIVKQRQRSLSSRTYMSIKEKLTAILQRIPFIGHLFRPPTQTKRTHLTQSYKRTSANYRIQQELKEFMKNPPDGCRVSVGSDLKVWIVTLTGAQNTVFAGEKYKLKVIFPKDYPQKPPTVYFLKPTPRHEHVYTNGDICLNLLGKDWRPSLTVSGLAVSILSMLSSAKEKMLPVDNALHAEKSPGNAQDQWMYHDDRC